MEIDDENIIGYDALWDSMTKCKRGVLWKKSVSYFVADGVIEIGKLHRDLANGTYREKPHKYFTIRYPKEREIMSINFRDRVYQRSLNDVAIYPIMSKSFIYDNAACQAGKGTDFARNRLKCHMQRFYRKYGANGYALKIDIRKYYDSMSHELAKSVFREKLPDNVYRRAEAILDGFPGDKGFNPGSQIIQIAGISVCNKIDHFAKEILRIKGYERYMDDTIILGRTIEELERIKDVLAVEYAKIGFELHPTKTKIVSLKKGFEFLGFTFRMTDTGKVLMLITSERVHAARKKYCRLVRKCKKGLISKEKVDESYRDWRAHASKGNNKKLLCRMDHYYRNLWIECVV